jgi:biopolymer transport protein ExbD
MPKHKKNRVGLRMDMTPMVDLGFLMLTFFMLTTQFRPAELPEAQVVLPLSHSDIKQPETDVMVITVNKDGGVFLSLDSQKMREALLTKIIQDNWEKLDPKVKAQYGDPVSMAKLAPSFPIQMAELTDLLMQARIRNPKLRTIVKGDKDTEYGPVMDVMDILQKVNITRFNLLTDLEMN